MRTPENVNRINLSIITNHYIFFGMLFMLRRKLFVCFYNRAPLVGAAARAGVVRKNSLSTLGTGRRVGNSDFLMGASHIPFWFGCFSFWYSHDLSPNYLFILIKLNILFAKNVRTLVIEFILIVKDFKVWSPFCPVVLCNLMWYGKAPVYWQTNNSILNQLLNIYNFIEDALLKANTGLVENVVALC